MAYKITDEVSCRPAKLCDIQAILALLRRNKDVLTKGTKSLWANKGG